MKGLEKLSFRATNNEDPKGAFYENNVLFCQVYSFYSRGSKVYTGYVPFVNRGCAKWVSSLSKMINSNFQP